MSSRGPHEERQMHSESRVHRRRLLQMALALTASSTASVDTVQSSTSRRSGAIPPMQDAIKSCLDRHSMCLQMATEYCLERGSSHVKKAHLRLLLICPEPRQTSANFMLSDSPLHGRVCLICAEACEACEACAKSCEQVGDMRDCVEECQRGAKSCRTMT